jgi:hypothetical protein
VTLVSRQVHPRFAALRNWEDDQAWVSGRQVCSHPNRTYSKRKTIAAVAVASKMRRGIERCISHCANEALRLNRLRRTRSRGKPEADLDQVEVYNRTAKEKRRERWASDEPLNSGEGIGQGLK